MRNTVPLSSVVSIGRRLPSSSSSLSTGKVSVDQTTAASMPWRRDSTFFAISSMQTTALPCASWPVTTRRTFIFMRSPSLFMDTAGHCGSIFAAFTSSAYFRIWSASSALNSAGVLPTGSSIIFA